MTSGPCSMSRGLAACPGQLSKPGPGTEDKRQPAEELHGLWPWAMDALSSSGGAAPCVLPDRALGCELVPEAGAAACNPVIGC